MSGYLRNYRFRRIVAAIGILAISTLYTTPGYSVSQEYQLKAAFIYKFLNFIEWNSSPADVKTICAFDNPALNQTLQELIKVQDPTFLKAKTHLVEKLQELSDCNVVFLSREQEKLVPEVLSTLSAKSALTISDSDHFARSGGMIQLTMEAEHVRFIINQQAAKEKGLQISSQLLALAKEVI